jgi:hypothetical protein
MSFEHFPTASFLFVYLFFVLLGLLLETEKKDFSFETESLNYKRLLPLSPSTTVRSFKFIIKVGYDFKIPVDTLI